MPKVIEVPNLGTVEFPDDTPDEAISSSITDHLDRLSKKSDLSQQMASARRERVAGDIAEKVTGAASNAWDTLGQKAASVFEGMGRGAREEAQATSEVPGVVGDISRAIPADIAAASEPLLNPVRPNTGEQPKPFTGNINAAIVGQPLPIDTAIQLSAEEQAQRGQFPIDATVASIGQGVAATAPLAALGVAPALAQKLLLAGFTAKQVMELPGVASELGAELGKPEDQRDPNKVAQLSSALTQNIGFTALGGAGLVKSFKPKGKANAETISGNKGQPLETGETSTGSEANRGGNVQQTAPGAPDATGSPIATPEPAQPARPREENQVPLAKPAAKANWDSLYQKEHADLLDLQKQIDHAKEFEPEIVKSLEAEKGDIIQRLGEFDKLSKSENRVTWETPKETAQAMALRENPNLSAADAHIEGQRMRRQDIEDRIHDDEPIPAKAFEEFPDLKPKEEETPTAKAPVAKPLKVGEAPTPADIHAATHEEFMAYHDAMKAPGEQRAAVNEFAKSLDENGIKEAERLAQVSRDKAKEIIGGDGPLETRFKQSMEENQRTQFLAEGARTAKAMKAVEEGSTPAEAAKKLGVPVSALETPKPIEAKAPEAKTFRFPRPEPKGGWETTTDWRKSFDQTPDLETKIDWLRAVANNKGSKASAVDMVDALARTEKLASEQYHSRLGNALHDISQNPASSPEVKARAKSLYDNYTAPTEPVKPVVVAKPVKANGKKAPASKQAELTFEEQKAEQAELNKAQAQPSADERLKNALSMKVDKKFENPYDRNDALARGKPTREDQANLSSHTEGKPLFHETSLQNVSEIYKGLSRPFKQSWTSFFASDNPDLAIGQKGKGILLEIDPERVNGWRHPKPGTSATTGYEYVIDRSIQNSVKSITFKTQRQLEAFRKRFPNFGDYENPQKTERGLKVESAKSKPEPAPEPRSYTSATEDESGRLYLNPIGPLIRTTLSDIRDFSHGVKKSAEWIIEKGREAAGLTKEAAKEGFNVGGKMNDYRRSVLNWSMKLQKSFGEAAHAQRDIQKRVPDSLRREAITNWIQADGDNTVLANRAATTTDKRLKKGYEIAQHLTPDEIAIAKQIKGVYDALGMRGQAYGVINNFKENYVTQIWNLKNRLGGSARTLKDKFKYAKARTFDSFYDGEQAGYDPKTKDISKLLPSYLHEMNSVIAARQLVKQMQNGVAADGRPLLVPRGTGTPVSGPSGDATLITPKAVKGDTSDYKLLPNQPALNDWVWAAKDQAGNNIFLKADLMVHPKVYDKLKNTLGRSAIQEWYKGDTGALAMVPKRAVELIDRANAETKRTMLGLITPFHQVQEGTHAVGHRVNPFSVPEIDLVGKPEQADAAKHGLMLLPDRASESQFMDGFKTTGLLSHVPGLGRATDAYSRYLFHDYIPGLKMKTYEAILERNKSVFAKDLASGAVSLEDVKVTSAEQTNAAYGHLNYADLGRNPTISHIARALLLAPDFFEARARFAGQAVKGAAGGKVGREQILALGFLALAQATGAYTFAKLSGGEWDKKHPFEFTRQGKRYTMRSVPEDISSLIKNPRMYFNNRMSPAASTADQFRTGLDWKGDRISAGDTLKEAAQKPIPLSVRAMLKMGSKNLTALEQLAGSIGLKISSANPKMEKGIEIKDRTELLANKLRKLNRIERYKSAKDELKDLPPKDRNTVIDKLRRQGVFTYQ